MRGALSSQPTKYNSAKIKGMLCEMCREDIAEEIHHLQEQRSADKNGRIGSIHKNHSANLMSLCEKCHIKMHHTGSAEKEKPKIIRKKTTKGHIVLATATATTTTIRDEESQNIADILIKRNHFKM
jgi:5-methylcytosine-specific restriction endonuclease McrA